MNEGIVAHRFFDPLCMHATYAMALRLVRTINTYSPRTAPQQTVDADGRAKRHHFIDAASQRPHIDLRHNLTHLHVTVSTRELVDPQPPDPHAILHCGLCQPKVTDYIGTHTPHTTGLYMTTLS